RILRAWQETGEADHRAVVRLLSRVLDAAVAATVAYYAASHQRSLRALNRISRAALESPSTDELLRRVLVVFVEETPGADTAALLLWNGQRLEVAVSVGLARDVEGSSALELGEGLPGRVAAERRPILVEDARTDPGDVSPSAVAGGVRALYGVPLLDRDELLGVAVMGSTEA